MKILPRLLGRTLELGWGSPTSAKRSLELTLGGAEVGKSASNSELMIIDVGKDTEALDSTKGVTVCLKRALSFDDVKLWIKRDYYTIKDG